MSGEERLFAGTVVKPQGIRGEVRVLPETDTPSDWLRITTAEIRRGGVSLGVRRVLSARTADTLAVLRLEGVEDRDAAEALREAELWAERKQLEKPGRAFLADIPGCTVSDETGRVYGRALRVEQYPGNDVLVLQGDAGEISFPMVSRVLREVCAPEKRILVDAGGMEETAVYED